MFSSSSAWWVFRTAGVRRSRASGFLRAPLLGKDGREPLEGEAGTCVDLAHDLLRGCLEHAEKRFVRRDDRRADVAHQGALTLHLGCGVTHPCRPLPEPVDGEARSIVLDEERLHGLVACSDCHAFDRTAGRGAEIAGVSLRLGRDALVQEAANTRRAPSIPFNSCSPAVLELEPGARDEVPGRRAHEHLAGAGERHEARSHVNRDPTRLVAALALHLACVDARPDRELERAQLLADCERAADRLPGPVEEGEEAVAGRVDLLAREPRELSADGVVVSGEKRCPRRVAERARPLRRADEIGEENRPELAAACLTGSRAPEERPQRANAGPRSARRARRGSECRACDTRGRGWPRPSSGS